ncbi:MAG: PTS IIA-like nitrogen regulatory protein PtsN [Alphaproteobacteria bacterium]|nr:PTS IIA-like nitrogen regulatory protein PtsN [Alphaproteobacteria bacterium]
MEVQQLMIPDHVVPSLKCSSKKQVLQELSRRAAATTGLNERAIFDTLLERERLGSTGVGNGIAIPHGRFRDLDTLHGFFARLEKPVEFDAVDDEPVDLVFMLLAPESAGADHLKALARISRLLRDRGICEKLRGCDNADALFALLTETEASHAA